MGDSKGGRKADRQTGSRLSKREQREMGGPAVGVLTLVTRKWYEVIKTNKSQSGWQPQRGGRGRVSHPHCSGTMEDYGKADWMIQRAPHSFPCLKDKNLPMCLPG